MTPSATQDLTQSAMELGVACIEVDFHDVYDKTMKLTNYWVSYAEVYACLKIFLIEVVKKRNI